MKPDMQSLAKFPRLASEVAFPLFCSNISLNSWSYSSYFTGKDTDTQQW